MQTDNRSLLKFFIGVFLIAAALNAAYDRYFEGTQHQINFLLKTTELSANTLNGVGEPVQVTYANNDLQVKILGKYKTYVEVAAESIYFMELFVLIAVILMWPSKYYLRCLTAIMLVPVWYGLNILRICAAYMIEIHYPLQAHFISPYILYNLYILLLLCLFFAWVKLFGKRNPFED